MSDPTPQDPPTDDEADVLAEDRDADDIASDELPPDTTGPTEFGEAVE